MNNVAKMFKEMKNRFIQINNKSTHAKNTHRKPNQIKRL